MTTDRTPPHNLEAEESLLGAMLLRPGPLDVGLAACTAEDFYKPAHGHIFEAARALRERGEPVDPVTLSDELRRADLLDAIGGPATLISLQANTPATTNAGRYASIIREHALLRRLLALSAEITERSMDGGDPADILAFARENLFNLEVGGKIGARSTASMYDEYLEVLERRYDSPESLAGLPTGFPDLDHVIGGLAPSSLTILGARPAMGKSAMACNIAAHTAFTLRLPVLVFSLEMGVIDVMDRLMASEAKVDLVRLRSGRLIDSDWPKISQAERVSSDLLLFEDGNARSVMEILAECRRQKARFGSLGLVIVDYLQLMNGAAKAENQQVKVSGISTGLKMMARDLDTPVLALSSLSRALELRGDKRPTMSDLKDSGSIEADADTIIFLYRDEVYSPESQDQGSAEVIVAKNRNGPTGMVHLAWLAAHTRFASMARI